MPPKLEVNLEIALSGVSAKVKLFNGFLGPGGKCVETSDDVIKEDFINNADSRK